MKINLVRILLATTIVSMLLAPMASPPAIAQPRYGGTLVWGMGSDPALPGILGAGAGTFLMQQVAHQMFNTLVAHDFNTGDWRPELAEKWDVSADGKTLKFYLVKNATWHDGKPFTSADVKFSYEKVNPIYNGFASMFMKTVKSIEAPDDYTLVMNLKSPWPAMFSPIQGFGGVGWSIVPKHLYENTDVATNKYNNEPVGTGPWRFKEWARGDHITLVRNEKYWKKGLPYLDQMIFKIIPTASGRALAFEKGEVDLLWAMTLGYPEGVALESSIKAGKLTGKRVWFYPSQSGSVDVLYYNLQPNGPAFFKDVNVRKAIAYAVNVSKINELVYYNKATLLNGPVSPAPATSWYRDPNLKQPTYDPAMANKLLDEAGYKRGPDGTRFKFRITVDSSGYPNHVKEGEVMRDYLKDVGIDLNIVTLDTPAWHDAVFKRWDYDTFVFPMSTGPDPLLIIRYYTGKGIEPVSWSNAGGYNNSKVNELFYASEIEPDRAKRADLVKQATKILVDDQAAFFLVARPYVNGVNLDFSDEFQPGAFEYTGGVCFARTERVYWRKAPAPTTTTTVAPPTQAPGVGMDTVGLIVAIVIIAAGVVYWLKKPKAKAA
jgi:peptide/nickel transport system substrate-binding protein